MESDATAADIVSILLSGYLALVAAVRSRPTEPLTGWPGPPEWRHLTALWRPSPSAVRPALDDDIHASCVLIASERHRAADVPPRIRRRSRCAVRAPVAATIPALVVAFIASDPR